MSRPFDDVIKARQLPAAKRMREEMVNYGEQLDDIRIQYEHVLDHLSYVQLKYKAFCEGALTEQEAVALRGYQHKLGIDEEVSYEIAAK